MDWTTTAIALGGVAGTVAGAWVTARYAMKNAMVQVEAAAVMERSRQNHEDRRERAQVLADIGSELFTGCQRLQSRRSLPKPERDLSTPPGWGGPTEHGKEIEDEIAVLEGMAARLAVRDPRVGAAGRDLISSTELETGWHIARDRFFATLSDALSTDDATGKDEPEV